MYFNVNAHHYIFRIQLIKRSSASDFFITIGFYIYQNTLLKMLTRFYHSISIIH